MLQGVKQCDEIFFVCTRQQVSHPSQFEALLHRQLCNRRRGSKELDIVV